MSSITQQGVRKTASLARLYTSELLSEELLELFTNQLESVLDYFNDIQDVDTNAISIHSGSRTITLSELRDDSPTSDTEWYERVRANIIANFPRSEANYCVIDGVFTNS